MAVGVAMGDPASLMPVVPRLLWHVLACGMLKKLSVCLLWQAIGAVLQTSRGPWQAVVCSADSMLEA